MSELRCFPIPTGTDQVSVLFVHIWCLMENGSCAQGHGRGLPCSVLDKVVVSDFPAE